MTTAQQRRTGSPAVTDGLTVGALAKEAGVGVETIRFYERERLLPKPPRSAGGYRKFPPEALQRLHFIRQAKELGFSLEEIRELLQLSQSRHSAPQDFCDAAARKVAWIDRRIAELQTMRSVLAEAVERCPGKGDKHECPVLALFTEKTGPACRDSSAGSCH